MQQNLPNTQINNLSSSISYSRTFPAYPSVNVSLTATHNQNTNTEVVDLKNGRYDHVPIEVVTETKKFVNVDKYYNVDKLHPYYKNFEMLPLFIMTAD